MNETGNDGTQDGQAQSISNLFELFCNIELARLTHERNVSISCAIVSSKAAKYCRLLTPNGIEEQTFHCFNAFESDKFSFIMLDFDSLRHASLVKNIARDRNLHWGVVNI